MRRLVSTLALALLAHAGAQELHVCGGRPGLPTGIRNGLYRGTLGGRPVALQVDRNDAYGTRYTYERIGLDITLTPFQQGGAVILQEEVRRTLGSAAVVTGCFTLRVTGSGLDGTWHAPGRMATLPVGLKALDVARLPVNLPGTPGLLELRREQPLTFVKVNRPWIRAGDGRSVREPLSQVTYPRVPGGSAALDGAFQDRQLGHTADALDCRSQLPEDTQGDLREGYALDAKVSFLSPHLVSVREDVSYFCGGAHPDAYTQGLILDRATGRPVGITQLWPTLNAQNQAALYLAHPAPDLDAECRAVLNAGSLVFTAHLSPAGLNLTPTGLPHVVAACGDSAVVPYAELRSRVNRASPYLRDLYPR